MATPPIPTVRHHIAWSYANLARAHAAVGQGAAQYGQLHHIIRARLFKGLVSGTMSISSIYEDERLKMTLPQCCSYCGSTDRLSLDHLLARSRGGIDDADNLVWACRSCNSSKQGRDLLHWISARDAFPSLFILRRYLKLVATRCDELKLNDLPLDASQLGELAFRLDLLPYNFPPLADLVLWVQEKN